MTLIKSISGIRGTIGGHAADNLTPIDVVKFTTAYARLIKEKNPGKRITVVVGRDARISGSMVDSLVEGTLLGTGVDVINVGLCTTPGTEMAVITHKADGGIIITASHNPRQWNALKLLNERGEFLDDAEGKQVLAMAEDNDYAYPTIDHIGKVVLREDFNRKHIEQVLALKLVDVEAVRKRKFKVVVDAVNSVGGVVIPELLRELGCEVVELNCEPTGEFAHNPEPLPENLTEISEVIRREGADLGVVVDQMSTAWHSLWRMARCLLRSIRWWLLPTTYCATLRVTPYLTYRRHELFATLPTATRVATTQQRLWAR